MKLRLAKAARSVNDSMVRHVLRLAREALRACGKSLRGAKVVVLGVSYKPDVKNPAGSKTAELVRELKRRCHQVLVYDPYYAREELEALGYPAAATLTEALDGANCLIVAVGHARFRELDLRAVRALMDEKAAVVDAGHVIDPRRARELGLIYRALGRGKEVVKP